MGKVNTMKQWIKRRRDKGIEPNADDIWNRINHNWPTLSADRKEEIFQKCD